MSLLECRNDKVYKSRCSLTRGGETSKCREGPGSSVYYWLI